MVEPHGEICSFYFNVSTQWTGYNFQWQECIEADWEVLAIQEVIYHLISHKFGYYFSRLTFEAPKV